MNWIILTGAVFISFIALSAWLIIHLKGHDFYRLLAVVGFVGSIPAATVALYVALGVAMPVGYPLLPYPSGPLALIGHKSVPGVGIFVLIDAGDKEPPKYYRLPWDRKLSEQIEGAEEGGEITLEGGGEALKLLGNWEFSFNKKEPKFTKEEPPQIQFEPKNDSRRGPAVRILPPQE